MKLEKESVNSIVDNLNENLGLHISSLIPGWNHKPRA